MLLSHKVETGSTGGQFLEMQAARVCTVAVQIELDRRLAGLNPRAERCRSQSGRRRKFKKEWDHEVRQEHCLIVCRVWQYAFF